MNHLLAVIKGDRSPGLYRVAEEIVVDEVATLCQEQGAHLFYIDGQAVSNKAEFLHACAKAMDFPDYFGANWDAFEDLLTDLEWIAADRYLVLYSDPEAFAQQDAAEWSTAVDILQGAVEYWAETETPLYVVFNTTSPLLNPVEAL